MRLSQEFHYLGYISKHRDWRMKDLVFHIGSRSQALFTLFFSIPFLLWIPLPGLSLVFGIFILFNGYRIAMRKGLWVPQFLWKRKMSGKVLSKFFYISAKILKFTEKLVRPRGQFLIKHPILQSINGWILAICGFFLILPLPPGTNFPPGLTTTLISLGILEQDGVFVISGYIAFACTLFIYIYLFIFSFAKIKLYFS